MKLTAPQLLAEGFGTAALLAVVVGSGIMGANLAQGNVAIALLANALATGGALFVLITLLAPISGAHFNPLVTAMMWAKGDRTFAEFAGYVVVQVLGAVAGVWLAHVMFDLPVIQIGEKARTGVGQWVSEVVATAGLLATILLAMRDNLRQIPALVGCFIASAYWFTASTSFANPAVTIARALTNSFAGIRPIDVPGFIVAQIIGTAIVVAVVHAGRPFKPIGVTTPLPQSASSGDAS